MDKRLYTAKDLAKALSVSEDTVWRWGRQGRLKRIKIGRVVRFEMPGKEEK